MKRVLALLLLGLSLTLCAAEPPANDASKILRLFVQNDKGGSWSATCFYVSETWLLTAAHTFKFGNHSFVVADGVRVPVTVVRIDYKQDICILETTLRNPSFFTLQRNRKLRALGFPGDTAVLTETNGTSNAKELNSSNPIYKGMSGGPIINESEEVVGMGVRSDPFKKNRCYSITSDKLIQFIEAAHKDGK